MKPSLGLVFRFLVVVEGVLPTTVHRLGSCEAVDDACYDTCRGISFRLEFFLNDGNSKPTIVRNRQFFSMIFEVYLGHLVFHPVAVFCFSKSVFGRS